MTNRLIIIFLTLLIACTYPDKYFNLNVDERTFINSFKKGDTILFESNYQDIDTLLVLGIDSSQKKQPGYLMAPQASNYVFVEIKHLPVDTFCAKVYSDSGQKPDTIPCKILGIEKRPQSKEVTYSISLKNFNYLAPTLGKLYEDTLTINRHNVTNYYVLPNEYLYRDTAPTDIKCVYLTKKEGLIGYRYNDGTCWIKKSSS